MYVCVDVCMQLKETDKLIRFQLVFVWVCMGAHMRHTVPRSWKCVTCRCVESVLRAGQSGLVLLHQCPSGLACELCRQLQRVAAIHANRTLLIIYCDCSSWVVKMLMCVFLYFVPTCTVCYFKKGIRSNLAYMHIMWYVCIRNCIYCVYALEKSSPARL